jgi:hypothetical protein
VRLQVDGFRTSGRAHATFAATVAPPLTPHVSAYVNTTLYNVGQRNASTSSTAADVKWDQRALR